MTTVLQPPTVPGTLLCATEKRCIGHTEISVCERLSPCKLAVVNADRQLWWWQAVFLLSPLFCAQYLQCLNTTDIPHIYCVNAESIKSSKTKNSSFANSVVCLWKLSKQLYPLVAISQLIPSLNTRVHYFTAPLDLRQTHFLVIPAGRWSTISKEERGLFIVDMTWV